MKNFIFEQCQFLNLLLLWQWSINFEFLDLNYIWFLPRNFNFGLNSFLLHFCETLFFNLLRPPSLPFCKIEANHSDSMFYYLKNYLFLMGDFEFAIPWITLAKSYPRSKIVGLCLLIFGYFSSPYTLIRDPKLIFICEYKSDPTLIWHGLERYSK